LKTGKPVLWTVSLVISFLVALAIAECIVRYVEYREYQLLQKSDFSEAYRAMFLDERDSQPYVFGHKPDVNIVLPQKGILPRRVFSTNSLGLRSTGRTADVLEFEQSIAILGDSVVEGATVSDGETFASLIEGKTGIPVLNFGVGSTNTAHQYYFFREKYRPEFSLSLILLAFSENDFEDAGELRAFSEEFGNWTFYQAIRAKDMPELSVDDGKRVTDGRVEQGARSVFAIVKSLLVKSRFLVFVTVETRRILSNFLNSSHPFLKRLMIQDRVSDVSDNQKAIVGYFLKKIRDFAKINGAKFYVVYNPIRAELEQGVKGSGKESILHDILVAEEIPFIQISEPLLAYKKNTQSTESWYTDPVHLSREGHKYFADAIYQELKREGAFSR
jgi:hypothetical protein